MGGGRSGLSGILQLCGPKFMDSSLVTLPEPLLYFPSLYMKNDPYPILSDISTVLYTIYLQVLLYPMFSSNILFIHKVRSHIIMKTASVIIIALAWFSATAAFPSLPIQESARRSISYRGNPPAIPERPTSSGPNSFHGSQFEFLEQTGYAPAVDAMPVFLYSRTTRTFVGVCVSTGRSIR